MKILALAALVLGAGCTTTQLVQRDGCWVRHTESFPKITREEIGICARPQPVWSNDRVARLVQECIAEADYRWQNEALAAWNQGRVLPPPDTHAVMQQCMRDASTELVSENEALKKRLAELSAESDTLRREAEADREHLRESQARMTDALGEAAKRPAPNAFATASSNGTASTRSDQQATAPGDPSPPLVPVPVIDEAPAPKRPPKHEKASDAPPACPLPGAPECGGPR